jgi:hypothetical protein
MHENYKRTDLRRKAIEAGMRGISEVERAAICIRNGARNRCRVLLRVDISGMLTVSVGRFSY